MPEANPTPIGLPHVVFLERAAREFDSSPGRFGQAAFLVLRLVDLLAVVARAGAAGRPVRVPGRGDGTLLQRAAGAREGRRVPAGAGAHGELCAPAARARPASPRPCCRWPPTSKTRRTTWKRSTCSRRSSASRRAGSRPRMPSATRCRAAASSGSSPASRRRKPRTNGPMPWRPLPETRRRCCCPGWGAPTCSGVAATWPRPSAGIERCCAMRRRRGCATCRPAPSMASARSSARGGRFLTRCRICGGHYERYEDEDQALRALHDLGLALARLGAVEARRARPENRRRAKDCPRTM